MDGFSYQPAAADPCSPLSTECQQTLKQAIGCAGIGLHSGCAVDIRLVPAAIGHGIVFRRMDLGVSIPARFDAVVDTRLCTMLGAGLGAGLGTGLDHGCARVGTVEHLMAALAASGIDNLLIELDGPEVPVLDGSSEPWLFLIDCAGIVAQPAPRRVIEVLRTVRAEDGDAFAELRPGTAGLSMALSIDFAAPAIGRQALSFRLGADSFRRELAAARTFAQKDEIEGLQRAGLAQGGSLDNAVVVDGARILNPVGLRVPDEFVRHKLLDAVGDLALAGGAIQGRFLGYKSGHALNNRLLATLFADAANWRAADGPALVPQPLAA